MRNGWVVTNRVAISLTTLNRLGDTGQPRGERPYTRLIYQKIARKLCAAINTFKINMDATAQTFEQDVLDPSHGTPIVVDFHATWCGPCQILKPMLEKLTAEYGVPLVKVDIDQNPELASQYQVQGVPDVRVFHQGTARPGFVGAPNEPQVRAFLEGLMSQSELDGAIAELQSLIATQDYPGAKAKLDDLFAQYPKQPRVTLAAAEFLIVLEQFADAQRILQSIAPNQTDAYPQAQSLLVTIAFQQAAQDPGDGSPVALQYRQAARDVVAQNYTAALEGFLDIVERDRGFKQDGARKAMLNVFTLLGAEHPLTQQYQQDLMLVLY